jgi:GNAT superfamily N-acetyltransferase
MSARALVRLATEDDLDAIGSIVSEVVAIMNAEGNFQWDDKYPQRVHFAKDIHDGNLWVAQELQADGRGGKVIGVAALTEDQSPEYADCGWDISIPAIVMHRAAVCPASHRTGVASLFFTKAEELARERGYSVCRIDTNKINVRMQGAIKRAGYEFSGEIRLLNKPAEMRFYCFQRWM